MNAPPDDTTADTSAIIAALRTERDAALAREAALAEALAQRNSEYGERIEHQSATIDVLKAMSASPGDTQPVFDLIVRRAVELCNAQSGGLFEYHGERVHIGTIHGLYEHDGKLLRVQSLHGTESDIAPASLAAYLRQFPMPPKRGSISMRAILDCKIMHIRDMREEVDLLEDVQRLGHRSQVSLPLLRDARAIGVITIAAHEPGGFSESQIALLKTFAEQAVIAITSAETFRALQTRTTDLQESLEYQTATSDVLKVISRSTFDLQPVLDTVAGTAAKLCDAEQAAIYQREGGLARLVANCGFPPEYEALVRGVGTFPLDLYPQAVVPRAIREGRPVHIHDVAVLPGYGESAITLGKQRTSLGVPLLREGEAIGAIVLARQRVAPFTDRQIELVSTFADQAVIAMENARLLGELRERTAELAERNSEFGERIEQQAAAIDVLKVMSSTPDDTHPVFEQICRRATELCNGSGAALFQFDGELVHIRTFSSNTIDPASPEGVAYLASFPMVPNRGSITCRAVIDKQIIHVRDTAEDLELSPVVRAQVRSKFGSQLSIPLMRDGLVIGVITLNAVEPGGFTDSQIALLQTFAEQAVIAITSVANFRALRERTEALARSVTELQALEEVLRAVNSSLDLNTVLETIISRAVRLSEADEGTIYEFDESERVFVPKSAYGMTEARVAVLRDRRIRIGETPLGISAATRAPLHIADLTQTPEESGSPELVRDGIHALLAVPLLREDKVVGGLVIRRRAAGGFPPSTLTLMQTFAGQSVLAIENARLFQQLAARGEEARRARITAESAFAELQTAQANLIQAEKMASLGQLTAGIAHEIKNPLNFVNNFAALSVDLLSELKETAAPGFAALTDDQRAEIDDVSAMLTSNLEKITEHGKRADGIVKAMLEHSRGSSAERRMVDLNMLIDEALNLAYHGARAQDQSFNITLDRDFGEGIAPIEVNPQDMTRVFLNIFSNGFYAATRRARNGGAAGFAPMLKVTTRDAGEAVEIRVRDNGSGIPAEIRDKLFQPFFTTKPTGEGTGLGLSITYDIVTKQHGGSITVGSEVDEFTEFVVTLPRQMFANGGSRA